MENKITVHNKRERLQYIDALRGFAMIMVVFVHVEIFSFFNFTYTTVLMSILSAVHMPLFFFISGFCVYNPDKKYDFTKVKKHFWRLIIPAILIGLVYTYFERGEGYMFFFANPMKAGYWFTISLFEILLIYYAISNLIKNKKNVIIALWIVASILYLLKLPFKVIDSLEMIGNYFCLHQTFNFFLFFVLGITVSKTKTRVEGLMTNEAFSSIILFLFAFALLLMFVIFPKYVDNSILWRITNTLGETFVGFCGVMLLYILFYKSENMSNISRLFTKILLLIGKNTLPIYLIHYFLLPRFFQLGYLLQHCQSVLIEMMLTLIVVFVVVAVSLLINQILIITSPHLGARLLGNNY